MKKDKKEIKNRIVTLRMNESEFSKAHANCRKTTEKYLGNYLRKLALHEPVTVIHRNGSADDFLKEMVLLRKELNAIGNNLNQSVHKLHTLDRIPEFRAWVQLYEQTRKEVANKTEAISLKAHQMYQQWSQG